MQTRKTHIVRLAAIAVTTLVVAACSSKSNPDVVTPPAAVNSAPELSAIADRASAQDTAVGPIEFVISDRESDAALLIVTAAAGDTSVFPADGLTLGGSGATRTITLTPLEAATGVAMITLTVTDPAGSVAARAFQVAVNARAASVREVTLSTFAKAETDDATAVNGFTFAQDADDPAIFDPLIGNE